MPLCPALLSAKAAIAIPETDGRWFQYSDLTAAPGTSCLGSLCAKWVPQSGNAGSLGPMYEGPITGLGWCADNLRRAPFADAAGGKE